MIDPPSLSLIKVAEFLCEFCASVVYFKKRLLANKKDGDSPRLHNIILHYAFIISNFSSYSPRRHPPYSSHAS